MDQILKQIEAAINNNDFKDFKQILTRIQRWHETQSIQEILEKECIGSYNKMKFLNYFNTEKSRILACSLTFTKELLNQTAPTSNPDSELTHQIVNNPLPQTPIENSAMNLTKEDKLLLTSVAALNKYTRMTPPAKRSSAEDSMIEKKKSLGNN